MFWLSLPVKKSAVKAHSISPRAGILGRAGAIVVAEPTSNAALVGHKGALWLRLTLKGVTAHGSMPHLGVNAAYKAARVLTALETFQFNVAPHPYLGSPTLNVGTVNAGLNVNSVPDLAEIGIDIRSIPGLDHSRIQEHLKAELGDDISLEPTVDVGAVWTDPSSPVDQGSVPNRPRRHWRRRWLRTPNGSLFYGAQP